MTIEEIARRLSGTDHPGVWPDYMGHARMCLDFIEGRRTQLPFAAPDFVLIEATKLGKV